MTIALGSNGKAYWLQPACLTPSPKDGQVIFFFMLRATVDCSFNAIEGNDGAKNRHFNSTEAARLPYNVSSECND